MLFATSPGLAHRLERWGQIELRNPCLNPAMIGLYGGTCTCIQRTAATAGLPRMYASKSCLCGLLARLTVEMHVANDYLDFLESIFRLVKVLQRERHLVV